MDDHQTISNTAPAEIYGFASGCPRRMSTTQGSSVQLSLEEQTVFTDMSRSASNLIICTAPLDYARDEIESDAKLQKVLRTAREEREAGAKTRENKG